MSEKRLKKGKHENKFLQIVRFWRREGKKYCAIALCASLIAGNIGHMAVAASEDPDYKFELTRQELSDALQEAIANANVVQDGDLSFAGLDADTYQISLAADGCLYELTPEIEENDDDVSLRIFVRLPETELINDLDEVADSEVEDKEASDGSENIYFLLNNKTDSEKTVTIRVDNKETEWITVEPYSAVEMPEPEGASKTITVGDGMVQADTEVVGPGAANTETEAVVNTGGSTTVSGGSSGGGSGSGGGGGSSGDGNFSVESTTESIEAVSPETKVTVENTEEMTEPETEAAVPETEIEMAEPETEAAAQETETEATEPETEAVEPETEAPADDDVDVKIDIEDNSTDEDKKESDVTVMEDETSDDTTVDTDVTGDAAADTDSGIDDSNKDEATGAEDTGTGTESGEYSSDGGEQGSDESKNTDLSAAISLHKTYRVSSSKATPSNATPSDATPSDATSSDAASESIDGIALETVRLGDNVSAVAYVTTLADIGITADGHFIECETDCIGEDCECGCHEVQKMLIADIEELLEKVRGYDENTDWETMYAAYDALYGSIPDSIETAYENGELTDAEIEYVWAVFETCGSEMLEIMAELGFDPYAAKILITETVSVGVGDTIELDGDSGRQHKWSYESSDVGKIAFLSSSTEDATVMGITPGTVTVTHSYRNNNRNVTETYNITVTGNNKIKVYVYVASKDTEGNSWLNNQEFLDLIGLHVADNNGYFPAGEIELDSSFLAGKTNANTAGSALLTSKADWTELLGALSSMKTDTLIDHYGKRFSLNQGNYVSQYLKQATQDIDYGWGSQRSTLFRWNEYENNPSYGFADQTVKFHLDLNFKTNKITFITGKNGIIYGSAQDGTTVDDRVYITGSLIQTPRNLTIPEGYKFVGYYEDADFTIPWDGIGTPLNKDEIVYIKITPLDNVIIHYVNVTGPDAGTLSSDSEGLNPATGEAKGSEATAKAGYQFAGWYEDKDCTKLITTNGKYAPQKPSNSNWIDGTTYYAKFVRLVQTVTVKKEVSGALGDRNKKFDFIITLKDTNGTSLEFFDGNNFKKFALAHNDSETFENIPVGTVVTVTEDYEGRDYTTTYTIKKGTVELEDEGTDKQDREVQTTLTVDGSVIIVFKNEKDPEIDTGILLDSMPYVLILAAAIAGAAFYFIRKKKDDEDDLD